MPRSMRPQPKDSAMLHAVRSRLTFVNLVAAACLFVVLGGDSFASGAVTSAAHLITGKNVKDEDEVKGYQRGENDYVILEDDEGSLRELVEMADGRQRTSPPDEPALVKEQGLKALLRGLKEEAEMEAIADALEKTHWSRKDAAKMLGISYKALLYKIRQFNLDAGRGVRSQTAAPLAPAAKES